MTACVNRKHTKKVAAVVTASLVGALSLGAAPVAAMAEDTGIDLQAAAWNTDVTVTRATDGKGAVVSDPMAATFTKGSGKFLVPVTIENDFQTTQVDLNKYTLVYSVKDSTEPSGYKVIARKNATTDTTAGAFNNVDTYYVQVSDGTDYTNRIAFKITDGQDLNGIFAYSGDVSNTEFTYNGKDILSGIEFADADGDKVSPDAGVVWKKTDGTNAPAGITNAGTYVATFEVGGKDVAVNVTVAALDLSTSSVTFDDIDASYGTLINEKLLNNIKINGSTLPGAGSSAVGGAGLLKVTSRSNPDGYDAFGPYTVTVASNVTNGNIKGSATVEFTRYKENAISSVKYGNKSFSSTFQISLLDGESFDESKIKVIGSDGNTYTGDKLELTYTKNGKTVDASALAAQGTYNVHIRVKPFQSFAEETWYGGSTDVTVKVNGTEIDADKTVAFYVDGQLAAANEDVTYDGTDQLEKISAVVKDADGNTMEEGKDYTFEVTKGGKEVDSIVDAGIYTIEIKPITFKIVDGNPSFKLEVKQVDLRRLVADTDDMMFKADDDGKIPASGLVDNGGWWPSVEDNQFYVTYTGSAIEVPGVKYEVSGDTYTYPVLSKDLYNVVSIEKDGKVVDEVKDEGTYTVKIALSDAAGTNYTFGATGTQEYTFTVKAYGHFVDVDSSKWYSVPVEKAYELGYVNGISGTNLFAPEADITRADAVCILFNMADGKSDMGDFEFTETGGWVTGFDDVDGHAYYAQALAWAKAFGVVNGYAGTDSFRPEADITREEFASMLANYAKAMGKFEAADEGALDSMSDANTVSDWAEANVAWAVENGVMGNGGFVAGQSNITRAEVAAMAVNYQPEAL